MGTTNMERKLEAYQMIINRAIAQNKYPIATAGVKLALDINPVCDVTRTLQSIIHHRQGRYDVSSQNLKNIITTVDSDTLHKVQSLLNTYNIPYDLTYYECLQDIHAKTRNDKIIKIVFLFISIFVVGMICYKFFG